VSVRRKTDAVMRLLRGEDFDPVARELRVEAHRLAAWRDESMAGGAEALKARPTEPADRKLWEAGRQIGKLTMELDVWQAAGRGRHQRGSQARAAPHAAGRPACAARARGRRRPRSHDGTIIPEAPNVLWGTDATMAYTARDRWVWCFVAVDHYTAEAWASVARREVASAGSDRGRGRLHAVALR
jgi:hypothetical protein